jgi:hypothetical protein
MAASDNTSFEPRRRLCPDGSCIGVISSDGRCSVCGVSASGDSAASPSDLTDGQVDDAVDTARQTDADQDSSPDAATSSSAFDPNRRLCGDDTCIGVIGKDNRCSVCGKAAGP